MLQTLLSLAGNRGVGTGGLQNYVPRTSVFGLNDAPQGFSLGAALSQAGPLLQGLGVSGDMMLQMGLPQLAARLQANAGVNPILLARQQQIMRETMRFSFGLSGQQVSSGLGLTPGSAGDTFLQSALPILQIMAPEMASELMSAVSPTTITALGGRHLVSAAAMRDRAGRVSSGMMDALRGNLTRLGANGKFRNEEFTHGFGFDDFSAFVEFAADEGLSDSGFDRRAARRSAESRLLRERFGGRDRSVLNADEIQALDAGTAREVDAEGLLRSGSLQARIGRQLQGMTGFNTGETLALMQQMGLRAGNEGESNSITKLLRELEALGQAAGQTTQNLLNAGRALQAQNGGSLLFNTQAAALAAATGRFSQDMAVGVGKSADRSLIDTETSKAQQVLSAYGSAGYSEVEARVEAVGTEEEKAKFFALKKAAEDDPTGGGARQYIDALNGIMRGQGSDLAKRAFRFQMSPAEREVFAAQAMKRQAAMGITGGGNVANARVVAQALLGQMSDRSPLRKLIDSVGVQGVEQMAAMFAAGGEAGSFDSMRAKFGDSAARLFQDAKGAAPGSFGDIALSAIFANAGFDNGGKEAMAKNAARMDRITKIREHLQTVEGINQGPLVRLEAGKIHGWKDVFESMGMVMSKEEADLVSQFSNEDEKDAVEAAQKRAKALMVLGNSTSTEDQKADARKDLLDAQGTLGGLGLGDSDMRARELANQQGGGKGAVGSLLNTAGEKLINAADKIMQVFGVKGGDKFIKAATAAPTGNGQAVEGSGSTDKPLGMKVEIDLKMNGQTMEPGKATAKITRSQGFRPVLLDGEQQV